MSGSDRPYVTPPPSYEEAVYGLPPPPPFEEPSDTTQQVPTYAPPPSAPPLTHTSQSPHRGQQQQQQQHTNYQSPQRQSPSPQPPTDYTSLQHCRNYPSPQRYTSHPSPQAPQHNRAPSPYRPCPMQAECLRNMSEILVYPSSGTKYKIKDENKVPIMIAKEKYSGDCCDSCTCDSNLSFFLYSMQDIYAAHGLCVTDSINCCSYNEEHLEVVASPDVNIGSVWIKGVNHCTVLNQSDDLLYNVKRESSWFQNNPYQIFSARGTQVGTIDSRRGIKNRLMLPRDMPPYHKILLLFLALYVQKREDTQRRSS